MRNAFLKNFVLSALICFYFNIQTAQAAVKLGSYYGKWASTVTYAAGDVVTFSNTTYLSLIPANKNKNPKTVVAAWQVLGLGATGPQGPQGIAGPQGLRGIQGLTGLQGLKGDTGIQGVAGLTGAKGDQGNIGAQGLRGIQGLTGLQGLKGDTGIQGVIGLTGAKGDQGVVGPQGPQGIAGDTGAIGPQGPKGDQGVVGTQGPQGEIGPKGDTGAVGAQGPQGIPGIGVKGDTGLTGPSWPQGPAGIGSIGTAVGDMQWWDGNAWVRIPVGNNNSTLKNCNGVPTWLASSASCPFLIGDTGPAGGKVFYLSDATGQHGLEAAPVDLGYSDWGCYGISVGTTSTAVGTGKANTLAINAKCGVETAAYIAASYTLNGFSDWYLPSKDELNLLYAQRYVVGTGIYVGYWSSSEDSSAAAWMQSFESGSQDSDFKNWTTSVKPVRGF